MSRSKSCLIGILLMLLTACSPEPSNVTNSCGVLLEYSKEFQAEAAKEYPSLGPKSKRLINDYKVTRDTIRVCNSHK